MPEPRRIRGGEHRPTVDLAVSLLGMSESNMAHMLAVGDGEGSVSFFMACRDDDNRHTIDAALLPKDIEIASMEEELPQHPTIVIRSYENIQLVMSPKVARAMAQWLLTAADWLESSLDGADK